MNIVFISILFTKKIIIFASNFTKCRYRWFFTKQKLDQFREKTMLAVSVANRTNQPTIRKKIK